MEILRIKKSQNVESVALLYEQLYAAGKNFPIQVPSDLSDCRICGKGDFLQFLLTWAEMRPDSKVVTHVPPNASEGIVRLQLENLFEQEHGLVLALRSRRFGVQPSRGFVNTRMERIDDEFVEQTLANTDLVKKGAHLMKGMRAFVSLDTVLQDSEGGPNEFANLYLKRNLALSPMKLAFESILHEIFKRGESLAKIKRFFQEGVPDAFIEAVVHIVYELFENAERWGTHDYGNSIRGVLVQLHARETGNYKSLASQVGSDNPILEYLRCFAGEDGFENTPFLEITVFDNGPTLAKHFLGHLPKSVSEELKATRRCLLFANGRSPKSNEGKGLYEAMRLLQSCKGFLKYRGNRLSVYRDFVNDPLDLQAMQKAESLSPETRQAEMLKSLILKDWSTRNEKPKEHPVACGSNFTIIVPVTSIFRENLL